MGFTVELPHAWEPYKAARAALANTIQPSNVKALHLYYRDRLAQARKMLQHYLTEGVLHEEFALDNTPALLHCVRECNVTIRWLMLHRTARHRRLPDSADGAREAEQLLLLLMNTAQLEHKLRTLFSGLLEMKQQMWSSSKAQAHARLTELAEFFSGERALTRVGKDGRSLA
jgi:WASH complex subunit strumpellin